MAQGICCKPEGALGAHSFKPAGVQEEQHSARQCLKVSQSSMLLLKRAITKLLLLSCARK